MRVGLFDVDRTGFPNVALKDGQVTLHDALRARQLMAQMAGRLEGDGTQALGQGLASLAKVLLGAFDTEEDRE